MQNPPKLATIDFIYKLVLPVCFAFLKEVNKKARDTGLTPYFMSRDGYIPSKLYRRYFGHCEYFYFSRRVASSLLYASRDYSKKHLEIFLSLHRFSGTLSQFVLNRLPPGVCQSDGWDYSFEIETTRDHGRDYLLDFIQKKTPEILEKSFEVKRCLTSYLDRLKAPDQWLIVDIGVYGTAQAVLQLLLERELNSLYLCGSHDNPWKLKNYHYLIDLIDSNYKLWSALLECALTAPHGTVTGFDDSGTPTFGRISENMKQISHFENMLNESAQSYVPTVDAVPSQNLIRTALTFCNTLSQYSGSDDFLELLFTLENDFVRPNQPEKKIELYSNSKRNVQQGGKDS